MAIIVNDREFVTLDDVFYVNGARVVEARLGDGRLVYPQDRKPYGIRIVRPPYRFIYAKGDTISYDGIEVVLLDKRGKVFQDERYPTGLIPFDELIFPWETVQDVTPSGYSSSLVTAPVSQPIPTNGTIVITEHINNRGNPYDVIITLTPWSGSKLVAFKEFAGVGYGDGADWYTIKAVSSDSVTPGCDVSIYNSLTGETSQGSMNGRSSAGATIYSYSHGGKTARYRDVNAGLTAYYKDAPNGSSKTFSCAFANGGGYVGDYYADMSGTSSTGQMAWTVIYGSHTEGFAMIPVNWDSRYEEKTFTDSFKVRVP